MKVNIFILAILMIFVNTCCADDTVAYAQWKEKRLNSLKKPHGWLSLVGMEWLKVGKNSIGSAGHNDIVLSHGPEHLGDLYLTIHNDMTFVPNVTSGIQANGQMIKEKIDVYADSSDDELTVFTTNTFQFYVIERGKMALRIKDSEAMTRLNFGGLQYFPENDSLRLKAQFVPIEPMRTIPIVNVMGQLNETESPGQLSFEIAGQDYLFDVLNANDSLYIIFGDKTNGHSTYGPGRFLYTDGLPDEQGEVILDFNKAYNPPCAFTPYSTCSLPPKQNRLPIAIEAGEKKYGNSVY